MALSLISRWGGLTNSTPRSQAIALQIFLGNKAISGKCRLAIQKGPLWRRGVTRLLFISDAAPVVFPYKLHSNRSIHLLTDHNPSVICPVRCWPIWTEGALHQTGSGECSPLTGQPLPRGTRAGAFCIYTSAQFFARPNGLPPACPIALKIMPTGPLQAASRCV